MDLLKDKIDPYVEFLPIEHEIKLYLVNIINVLDCVDLSRSLYTTLPSGEFIGFTKICFLKDALKDQWIFTIREHVGVVTYVTDKFRNVILNSDLKGFDFIEIWDSEITVEIEQERELRYEQKLAEIEQNAGTKMNWATASKLIEAGRAIASGKWRIQKNKQGRTMLGQLMGDLSYMWTDPVYYPPILLELEWHETESSDI